jgi:hypothetical protein
MHQQFRQLSGVTVILATSSEIAVRRLRDSASSVLHRQVLASSFICYSRLALAVASSEIAVAFVAIAR